MLNRYRFSSIFIACALMIALSSGGLMHSVIPHTHNDGHAHGNQTQESPVWVSLHHSLSHEQKKFLALALAIVVVSFGAVVDFATRIIPRSAFRLAYIRARDPNAGELLRRGILPHRRFG